jgi:hypothetical protein
VAIRRYAAELVTVTGGSRQGWKPPWRASAVAVIAGSVDRPLCRMSGPTAASKFKAILCVAALDGTDDPPVRFTEVLARRALMPHSFCCMLFPEVSEAHCVWAS